ncbi:citrate/2-methylcitrate synthase [Streptomyces sp. P1-3]|uniref:citrate/2-methylcitrate synthase n=1 Tax=Streptomyces sp. P1-3 TaxID=3421658 RepID=UPI003D35D1B4
MTDQGTGEPRLSTREAAERLGVKPETVYAYVSRGQLTSRRIPGGRGSTFDAAEVEALARRNKRETRAGVDDGPIGTSITLIENDRHYYRGVDSTKLAERYGYEEVAQWLWTGELRPGIRFTSHPETLAAARRAVAALPEHSGLLDRLRVAAIAAAAADPLRFELERPAVVATARDLIATLADVLPVAGEPEPSDAPVARRLWTRLTARAADDSWLRVVDSALVLLIDHELAVSTMAARVAASAQAHPYAVVSAGLGALDGPLHGGASGFAHRMLMDAVERGGAAVVADHLRAGRRVPGLGHKLYPGEDPRAQALFTLLEEIPQAAEALRAAREIVATMARHVPLHANVDLALAVLSVAAGMPQEAGETVFAVARTAGWIAHALEEYGEQPLRMRPTGQYRGPRPPQPPPLVPMP